jgi:DNA end-binding protein Ku
MAPRAISSAQISFGLVTIPVKIYTSTQASSGISFNMLHERCGTRLRQQLYCPKDDVVVDRGDVVKGYPVAEDRYVTFTAEELRALEEEATKALDIAEFVPAERVSPVYYERAYYLGPDKGGDKPYRLLVEAMKKTGLVGLARYAARGKQYLVMIRPEEDRLVMQQLFYADEVRPLSEVPGSDAEVRDRELSLAVRLIEQIASDEFHPESYEDTVRERMRAAIDQKLAGEEITIADTRPEAPKVINLMEALEASLERTAARQPRAVRAQRDEQRERARKPARKAAQRKTAKAAGKKAAK